MFQILFPGDEKMIRKLLAAVAETASLRPNTSALAKLGGANKLGGFFTPDVVINLDVTGLRVRTINGRNELVEIAAAARANLQEAKIRLYDVVVEVAPDRQTATVQLTVLASIDGSTDPVLQLMKMRMKKIDGAWKISEADPVKSPRV